jgi:hypothetical protein
LAVFKTDHGNDYSNPAQTKAIKNRSIRGVVMNGFGCVEWLAAKNFWRLRRNFFLDSPFIEPLPVLTVSDTRSGF